MFYLRNAAGDVGIEIEILLHGRHEDQLADKTVIWRCGCEVCLKNLNNIYIMIKGHLCHILILRLGAD